jgi:alkanesulfonate monooxygenase SsuD/methylene tetrahydromethanopterin reductase-like flavin-dependent oxidoreductase (luciferase family)
MRTATSIEASGGDGWQSQAAFVVEAEKLGLDLCLVAEAWGSDAPSALGYYAARTERIQLGSGIIQIGTRTPVAIAQAAITLSNLSQGRFLLVLQPHFIGGAASDVVAAAGPGLVSAAPV